MLMSIRNLDVRYGRLDVIRNVELDVEDGHITVIVGANGAGKTTLLRTVAGLNTAARGSIHFKGQEITNLPAHRVAALGISMVPEGRHLFREMTVQENLEMGGFLCRKAAGTMAANLERVYDLFPVLKEHRGRKAKTFSGGQQQMITIGRGLMSDPKLLIIDELSLGLAPKIISEILEKIVLLNQQGMSIYLVEQNVKQALKIAHYGYVLDNGSITIQGNAQDLLDNPEVQRTYLGI
ncbi:ABC transporter ATP-binding protein [Sulfitobacter geojensis]|uniref:ABC transporter ATP-binding protein n=5 Tax=Sulfitobacter geojensis TaxID=1342299 RepID=A0AAE3B8P7_9RHOB|nr:ABC transporter ATP-binding protein [Sulfitobacter geojensis]MBM1695568.1 ABC transporter ATP-binding protein [Sulfitobacter geojensis]MBM1707760.1 ABC transporter ATP-binding protein [Sulfitobacter geojensis]MBM1711834.1 ABC transporter ATP-binding protein [Sulfitobacter geojensis]MBM1715891.1 ABC transporter ATP-binding protein [Sulfitobacter geojensis]